MTRKTRVERKETRKAEEGKPENERTIGKGERANSNIHFQKYPSPFEHGMIIDQRWIFHG